MMKRSVLLMTVLFLFCITGCNSHPLEETYTLHASPQIDNDTPYDQLITQEVDIHTVMQTFFTSNIDGSVDLADINQAIGIECLRTNDDGLLYSVHRVKQGGLLYLFYDAYQYSVERPVYSWFYVQKKLERLDFGSIQEGSTMDEVIGIDPTTQIFENLFKANPSYADRGAFSRHYLQDGILELSYQYEEGRYVVRAQEFYEDFALYESGASIREAHDGHILSQDWIA